jgi:hypothetical protein
MSVMPTGFVVHRKQPYRIQGEHASGWVCFRELAHTSDCHAIGYAK